MTFVREAERNSAYELSVVAKIEVLPDRRRLGSECRLRDCVYPQRPGSVHEVADVSTAVHRTVNAQRFVRRDDCHMWRTEEPEVLEHLPAIRRLVSALDAECVVELEAALLPPLVVDTPVFAGKREVGAVRRAGASRVRERAAQPFGAVPDGHDDLPWLTVAPRRGPLGRRQNALDRFLRNGLRLERPTREARLQKRFELVNWCLMGGCHDKVRFLLPSPFR